MRRNYIIIGTSAVILLLLAIGRYVWGVRQDAHDRKASMDIERQFAVRQGTAPGPGRTAMNMPGGGWRGRQGGPGGGPGRGNRNPGQGREQMRQEMAKEVGLSADQQKRIEAIQQSSRPLMQDVFRNPQLTREQKMAQGQQLRQAQQQQITKILSSDQQTKYTAFQEKMRARWQANRPQRGPWNGAPGRPNGGGF